MKKERVVDSKKEAILKEKAALYLKKLEEKLGYYKKVVIDSNEAIIVQDFNGIVKAWNKGAERIYGFKEKEMLGQNIAKIIAKEERAEAIKNINSIRHGKPTFKVRQTRVTKDNKKVFVTITYSPIYEDEEIIEIATTEEDISELKKSLEIIVNTSPLAVIVFNAKSIVSLWNKAAENIFGWGAKEVVGKTIPIIPPDKIDETKKECSQILSGKNVVGLETECICKDGSRIFISFSATKLNLQEGQESKILAVISDITERIANKNLIKKEFIFTSLLQKIGSLYITTSNIQSVFDKIVEAAIKITEADMGNLQLVDPKSGHLNIVAHRGFSKPWLDFWEKEGKGLGVCRKALKQTKRVIVEDVAKSPIFAGKPSLKVQLKEGVRAVQSTPIINRSGNVIGIFSTHYRTPRRPSNLSLHFLDLLAIRTGDIIEKKQAEEDLKERERQFRQLFDNMNECVAIYEVRNNGEDIIIKDFNRAAERLEKVNKKNIIGKKVDEVFKGVKEFGLFDVFKTVWKTGKPILHPTSFYKDAYHKGWRENFVFKLPSGEIVAIYSDVTERKKAEEKLIESNEKYSKLFDKAIDAIFIADPITRKIIDCNKAAEKLVGYSRNKILSMKADEIPPKDLAKETMEKFKLQAEGKLSLFHTEILTKNHKRIPVAINAAIISIGNKHYLQGIFRDITNQIEAEKTIKQEIIKLKELDKLKSMFLSNVSHELRTPLTPIISQIDRLKEQQLTPESQTESFNMISRNVLRLDKLIDEILEISRIQSGMLKLYKKKVCISFLINQTIELISPLIAGTKIKVLTKIKDDADIFLDKDRILSVLINLFDNAIKFNGSTDIIVEVSKIDNTDILISVKDNGVGIPEEDKPKIFQPFFRSEKTYTYRGTGLGLSICKAIVEAHGGKIGFKSKSGKGTTFFFTLPLRQRINNEVNDEK